MEAIPHDTNGMMTLHDPVNPVVDICFIHGVNGGNVSTWTMKSESMYWPRDLLPKDIPDARILSFGYEAKLVDFWAKVSQNSLGQHADNLISALVGQRVDLKSVSYD